MIQACPKCASQEFHLAGGGDVVFLGAGEPNFPVCSGCGYRGPSLEFEKESDYSAFAQSKTMPAPAIHRRDLRPAPTPGKRKAFFAGAMVSFTIVLALAIYGMSMVSSVSREIREMTGTMGGLGLAVAIPVFILPWLVVTAGTFVLGLHLLYRSKAVSPPSSEAP